MGRLPGIHQHVWLETEDGRRKYPSTVLECGERELVVQLPLVRGNWVTLNLEDRVCVIYTAPDGAYRITGEIIRRQTTPPAALWIEFGGVKRVQRRDFMRLGMSVPVKVTLHPGDVAASGNQPLNMVTRTRDVSAGGAQLVVPEPMSPGSLLKLELCLSDFRVETIGRVVRSAAVNVGSETEQRIGVQFVDISDSLRDKIVRYLFAEEIRRRREQRD